MPLRTATPKEMNQMLGLTCCYQKFIPAYSDLVQALTPWGTQHLSFCLKNCQNTFEMLNQVLLNIFVLVYPDQNKAHTLFTGMWWYIWSNCHTRMWYGDRWWIHLSSALYNMLSDLFQGSQWKWKSLCNLYGCKEFILLYCWCWCYILKWPFTMEEMSSQLTLTAKANKWGVQHSDYCVKFKFIKGMKNTLANTLSRLTDHDLIKLNPPEKDGYDYGYSVCEPLTDIDVTSTDAIPIDSNIYTELEKLWELQQVETFCISTMKLLHSKKLPLMR